MWIYGKHNCTVLRQVTDHEVPTYNMEFDRLPKVSPLGRLVYPYLRVPGSLTVQKRSTFLVLF